MRPTADILVEYAHANPDDQKKLVGLLLEVLLDIRDARGPRTERDEYRARYKWPPY